MSLPAQGEVWWAEADDKRRPVLIVTRREAIPVLAWLVVAPVTKAVRDIPTEVALGPHEGLPEHCAATFDKLQPIRRGFLTRRAGRLDDTRREELCRALSALADC